jgi:drug/metabolite transporter (DMT)-like permease
MNVKSNKFIGEFALLLVTILWGGTFVIVKGALQDTSPMIFIGLRFLLASILFIPFIFYKIKTVDVDTIKAGFVLGVLLFLSFSLQTIGLQYTSATKSGFLTGTLVVLIPFFQIFIKKKIPSIGTFIGTGLVFIGIFFLSGSGNSILNLLNELGNNFNLGDLLTLLCAVLFAVHVVYLDVYTSKYNFWFLVFSQLFITAIFSFISAFIFNANGIEKYKFELTDNLIFAVLYTAIFATLINTILQTKYQKMVSPAKAGIIYSFEPIFAAVFAFIVLDERLTLLGFIGCFLIFLGLIIAEVYDNLVIKNGK